RIDRLDKLEDETVIPFDFKANAPNLSKIQGERLVEPQLPFYAVTESQPVGGVAYASMNKDDLRFKGVASKKGSFPGESLVGTKDWPDSEIQVTVDQWRTQLTAIAREYISGHAVIDP